MIYYKIKKLVLSKVITVVLKKYIAVIHIAILMSCTLMVYFKIYQLDFQMQWDDYWVVINPYTNKGFSFQNIQAVFSDFYHSQYAPLNEVYYIFINSLFGYDAFYFHAGSLIIHLANTVLVYFLILRICALALNYKVRDTVFIAFFTVLIFALHPLNLEAVAWIGASKVLIYAFFYLAALHLYITFLASNKYLFFCATVLFFILSFGGKEQAVTLPVCLLLLDFMFNRNFNTWPVWFEKVGLILLSVCFVVITIYSQGISQESGFDHYSFVERLILSFYTLSEYITKCIFPINLSYIYPFPFRPGEAIPLWLFVYPILLAVIAIGLTRTVVNLKWLLFGTGFFLIHIAVALHLIGLARHAVVADRYAYLSSIGAGFIICNCIWMIKTRIKNKYLRYAPLYVYILLLALYTNTHLSVWKNSGSLKKEVADIIKSRKDFEQVKQKYEEE